MMVWRNMSTLCSTDSVAIWMSPMPVAILRWLRHSLSPRSGLVPWDGPIDVVPQTLFCCRQERVVAVNLDQCSHICSGLLSSQDVICHEGDLI